MAARRFDTDLVFTPMKEGILVLCGGQSSRMGREKGLIQWNENPLIQHVLDAAEKLELPILLAGNPAIYGIFGHPVVSDPAQQQGPKRGILTGMQARNWDRFLVLSCDSPFLTSNLFRHLLDNCTAYEALIPRVNDRIHPLTAVYSREILPLLESQLAKGQFRMDAIPDVAKSCILDLSNHPEFGSERLFANLNTPEDLKRWE